jgi:sugar transferase (PEP-CTERM/EpsH1 system associated)
MRALILSPVFLWPPNSGEKIRMFHTIKHLSRWFDITLLSLAEEADVVDLGPIADWCEDVRIVPGVMRRDLAIPRSVFSLSPYRVVKFWAPQLQKICDTTFEREQFDVIWINFLNMMVYLRPSFASSGIVVLDQISADERIWIQYLREGSIPHRLFSGWNLLKVRRFQRRMLQHIDVLVAVSDEEADLMQQRVPASARIWTVPNGVDTAYFRSDSLGPRQGDVILFCGSMDVTMNVDAVCYFAHRVFPVVRHDVPDAELWIVGRNPSKQVRRLASLDGVRVTGAVEDVRPFYEKAKVSVAPFRFGAGTKLKILEAMAMGTPVVSTSSGCQGLDVQAGKEIQIADDAGAFADAVTQLLLNEQSGLEMRLAARNSVEKKHDWGVILERVGERLIQEILDQRER